MLEETGLKADQLKLIGITRKPKSRSVIYAYLATVKCEKDSVRLQPGETVDYRWVDAQTLLRLMREEPVLKMQHPRYKPYPAKTAISLSSAFTGSRDKKEETISGIC